MKEMDRLRYRKLRQDASAIFQAGLRAVDPEVCIPRMLRLDGDLLRVGGEQIDLRRVGRLCLVGAGKASAAMASVVEGILGDRIDAGLVVTKYGHGLPLRHCRLMEAGHPVPDENGLRAAEEILALLATAGPDDLVLCLWSGGGSALTPAPVAGVSLADKQQTTRLLLSCGATIHQINTIRKHLSRLKGGRFCRAAGDARIVSLILSDVIGDDLDIIASGMTAPDTGTFGDCLAIIDRYQLAAHLPASVHRYLNAGVLGRFAETPKPGDQAFLRVLNLIVGSNSDALGAAGKEAARLGYSPLILTSTLCGEAREAAKVICAIAGEVARRGQPVGAPACLLFGGETTVTVTGGGLGGRNTELALAAAIELDGRPGTLLLSAGTDGTDGPTDAAGAFADGASLSRAQALGLDSRLRIAENDSYNFFNDMGDLLITGPTRTNVMDLQIVLVVAPECTRE